VHLSDWPLLEDLSQEQVSLLEQMKYVRKIVELGLAARKELQIKVKQPLAKIMVRSGKKEQKCKETLNYLILDELNIKEIVFAEPVTDETTIELDTHLTGTLIAEGKLREIVRKIQEERKKIGTNLDEQVNVTLVEYPKEFEESIKQQALVKNIAIGSFSVERIV
jgi:isoleucyl-tRNA synthetase